MLNKQKGTVLIIAVFFASVIAAIAARFTGDFQLSAARTEQGLISAQLQQFFYSVESFAGWVLIQDADDDSNNGRYKNNGINGSYDHLQEEWMQQLNAPIEEAEVTAHLEDAQGRFNLNQLQGRPSPYKPTGTFSEKFTVAQQRFIRLLQTYPGDEVSLADAVAITEAVIDWVDIDDTVTGQGGAEDSFYGSQDSPYRPANQFFTHVSELRLVKGVTREIYDYLQPLVIALPNKEGVNINTALAPVMRSLNQKNVETPLSETDVSILLSSRPQNNTELAYRSVDGFLASSEANQLFGVDAELWPSVEGLRTGSEFFLLTSTIRLLDYQQTLTSLIKRESVDTGINTRVLRRIREQL